MQYNVRLMENGSEICQLDPRSEVLVLARNEVRRVLGAHNQPTKAYVVAGDKVEASGSEPEDDTVLARFAGKTTTIGRLKLEDLDWTKAP